MSSTGRAAARAERGRVSGARGDGALDRLRQVFERLLTRRAAAAATAPLRKASLDRPSIDPPTKPQSRTQKPKRKPAEVKPKKHAPEKHPPEKHAPEKRPPEKSGAKPRAKPKPSAWRPAPLGWLGEGRAPALDSRQVTVEGVRIHAVEREGAETERAIILVHGAGLDHRDWTYAFVDRLARGARIIAFDRPGFGHSERPRGPAAALPAVQARLLRGAAEAMGVRRAVVVGHSWGGAVAMAWGLDAPDATIGVASLAGAVAPWSFASSLRNGARIQAAARTAMGEGGLRRAAIEAIEVSFAPDPIPERYLEHIETRLTPLDGPAASTLADVSTINGSLALMTPRYRGFERPVELVYGDADAILSAEEQGAAAANLLPKARLTVLPETGHMVHHAQTEICVTAVERLWKDA